MGMGIWLAFGLGAALGDSGADVLTKRYFAQLSPYGMALVRLLGAVPFLALVALGLSQPELTRPFWLIVAAMLPLEVLATLLYMRALRLCHLSLCVPFPGLYPGFPDLHRLGGAGRTSEPLGGGRHLDDRPGVLRPGTGGRRPGQDRGPGAAEGPGQRARRPPDAHGGGHLLFDRRPVQVGHSPLRRPLFRDPVSPGRHRADGVRLSLEPGAARPSLKSHGGWWVVLGLCSVLSYLCLAGGMELAPAAYLVAVKRLSLLLSVLLGGLWLKERPFLPRVLGAGLMCAGVGLIALRG